MSPDRMAACVTVGSWFCSRSLYPLLIGWQHYRTLSIDIHVSQEADSVTELYPLIGWQYVLQGTRSTIEWVATCVTGNSFYYRMGCNMCYREVILLQNGWQHVLQEAHSTTEWVVAYVTEHSYYRMDGNLYYMEPILLQN